MRVCARALVRACARACAHFSGHARAFTVRHACVRECIRADRMERDVDLGGGRPRHAHQVRVQHAEYRLQENGRHACRQCETQTRLAQRTRDWAAHA
eukprot:6191259-Pleurochrysis_carterae.AAC.2